MSGKKDGERRTGDREPEPLVEAARGIGVAHRQPDPRQAAGRGVGEHAAQQPGSEARAAGIRPSEDRRYPRKAVAIGDHDPSDHAIGRVDGQDAARQDRSEYLARQQRDEQGVEGLVVAPGVVVGVPGGRAARNAGNSSRASRSQDGGWSPSGRSEDDHSGIGGSATRSRCMVWACRMTRAPCRTSSPPSSTDPETAQPGIPARTDGTGSGPTASARSARGRPSRTPSTYVSTGSPSGPLSVARPPCGGAT